MTKMEVIRMKNNTTVLHVAVPTTNVTTIIPVASEEVIEGSGEALGVAIEVLHRGI